MSRASTSRPPPATNENDPPASTAPATPVVRPRSTAQPLGMNLTSTNNTQLRRSSPRISTVQDKAVLLSEESSQAPALDIHIQAPTSESRSTVTPPPLTPPLLATPAPTESLRPTPKSRSRSTSSKPRVPTTPSSKRKSTPKSRIPARRKSIKLVATPTITLPFAPGAPDSDGDDPLMLTGGEAMRGWGEGKPKREGSWGGSFGDHSRRGSMVSERQGSVRRSMSVWRSRDSSASTVLAPNSASRNVVASSSQSPRSRPEQRWSDEDIAPLGSGNMLSDSADPWLYEDDDHGINFDIPSPDVSEDEVEVPVESPARSSTRDYEMPVTFGSPSSVRKILKRPSSPAPPRRTASSSPTSSNSTPVSHNSLADISLPLEVTVERSPVQHPLAESARPGHWRDAQDCFTSSSSTETEQAQAERERWKGEAMSDDSVDLLSQRDLPEGLEEQIELERAEAQEALYEQETELHEQEGRDDQTEDDEDEDEVNRSISAELLPTLAASVEAEGALDTELSDAEREQPTSPPRTDAAVARPPSSQHSPPPAADITTDSPVAFEGKDESPRVPSLVISRPLFPPTPYSRFQDPDESGILPTPQVHRASSATAPRPRPRSSIIVTSAQRSPQSGQTRSSTLPVVEIFSTDARAAAEATACLRLHFSAEALEQPKAIRLRKGRAAMEDSDDTEPDEHLNARRLLQCAKPTGASTSQPRNASPTTSLVAIHASSSRRASPAPQTDTTSSWTTVDWRHLEQALVDEKRVCRYQGRDLHVEAVVQRYVHVESLEFDELRGEWRVEKLEVRVGALLKRRARDAEVRSRALSGAPSLPTVGTRTLAQERLGLERIASSTLAGDCGSDVEGQGEEGYEEEEQEEQEPEHEEERGYESSSSEEEDREHDTFFGQNHHPLPVLTLASSRHSHLYDDPVEKPTIESWRGGFRIKTEELDEEVADEMTPEVEEQEIEEPSSARKLLAYMRTFVQRSGGPPPSSSAVDEDEAAIDSSSEPDPLPVPTHPRMAHAVSLPSSLRKSALPRIALSVPATPALPSQRRLLGESHVQASIEAIETTTSTFKSAGIIPFDLSVSASGSFGTAGRKRVASEGDLRALASSGTPRGGWNVGESPMMIPSGTRALDRRGRS